MVKKGRGEQPGRPGRKPALNAEHTAVLRAITQEQPLVAGRGHPRVVSAHGRQGCTVTVRKALRQAGIERLKPLRRRAGERAPVQGASPARYGYTAALHEMQLGARRCELRDYVPSSPRC